jgi:dipeptidyl aminopeptidase/acylaminoacyl peptidase
VVKRAWLVAAATAAALSGVSAGAASPSIPELVEVADLGSLSLSPDGNYLLFRTERADLSRNSYDLAWHSYDVRTGELRRIAGAGDPIYSDPGLIEENKPVWLADGRSFAYRALVDGAIGIWRAAADRAGALPLVVRDSDVEQLQASDGGAALTYRLGPSRAAIAGAERSEYESGIKIDGSVDLAQNLFRGGSIGGRMATQRFVGYWFVRDGLLWRSPRQTYRFVIASGAEEAVGPARPAEGFRPPAATASGSARREDGSEAHATWNGASGEVSARIAGASPVVCSDPSCKLRHVSWLAWLPGTSEVVLAFIDRNRRQSLAAWDVGSNRLRPLLSSDGLLSGNRWSYNPCAVGRAFAFCVSASAGSPPRLERIDLGSGEGSTVFDPNAALRAAYRPNVEQLSWRGSGGQTFNGTLLTAPGTVPRRAPLFVNYYKCDGFLRGGEGDAWPVPDLLDAGFAVACINAAPSTGPQDAVGTYRTGLDGVRSLVDLLDRRGLADRRKVAMGGFSFGSEVATWVAIHSDLLAAVSIASAQYEQGAYWLDTLGAPDRAKMMRDSWHLGTPDETPARWRTVSPALNAAAIHAATIMQLPEQEARRIPELAAKLMASRTPAELFAFPDEDHIVVQPRHRAAIYQRNLDWFRYWLQDHVDPDPAKAGQYRRWAVLRARSAGSVPPGAHPQLH